MSRGTEKLIKDVKKFADIQYKIFTKQYGHLVIDIVEFPLKLVLSPFTLAFSIAGSAPRGFGIPEFISKASYSAIFESGAGMKVNGDAGGQVKGDCGRYVKGRKKMNCNMKGYDGDGDDKMRMRMRDE
ncbi:hypothetical protein KSS87_012541 [Heliosperma pusillum]|nr:hypothetical protein KSS87_012541 [Heliosperma pusillum]